uniref:Reverse transcriptase domain-containing protein n=1 Tax=Tanacetum cinerariifolium TaxID=118510 RepID=A0A6L2JSE0_TANCI|nr:reverse transcriptase domain-containing protein [Tanacetum cinerariifolium]
MTRTIRINVPLVDVLAEMPNYGKFLKELVSNKHKLEQISAAFLSDESSALIQNKVPPKLRDPISFLIPCNFNKAFSCDALADLCASINLMQYSLYVKLSLETLKPTKISVRLADKSFQYPVRIAENMLVEVTKFTFPINVILEIEEDNKVPLNLGRPFLHTADAIIRVKQKQLNLGVVTECMTFHMDSTMKHSYLNDDTCFSIDVIDEILKEDFDALLDEGSKIIYSIEGTILKEKLFAEFDEFMAMTAEENFESKSDTKEPPFVKITFNTDYKIKISLEEPPTDLELKPLPHNLEYAFLKEPWEGDYGKTFAYQRMPSGMYNAPATFQCCMMAIFHEQIEESMKVFMDDLSTFGSSFDHCLANLEKDSPLVFSEECIQAFDALKHELTQAPIMIKPDWSLPFKIMCDVSDYIVKEVLGQRRDKPFQPIHYASKIINEAQENYMTSEKEFLAILLLQKFDIDIRDKKGAENLAAYHLSRLENPDLEKLTRVEIRDLFPEEQLMLISDTKNEPWYADYANYLASRGGRFELGKVGKGRGNSVEWWGSARIGGSGLVRCGGKTGW